MTPEDSRLDMERARRIDEAGDLVSGLDHELANQLWALAAKVRRQARMRSHGES